MLLIIKGKKQELEGSSYTIPELLKRLNVEYPDMVTVEVNGEIIEKARYKNFTIQEGDSIDFLYFMGGGKDV